MTQAMTTKAPKPKAHPPGPMTVDITRPPGAVVLYAHNMETGAEAIIVTTPERDRATIARWAVMAARGPTRQAG